MPVAIIDVPADSTYMLDWAGEEGRPVTDGHYTYCYNNGHAQSRMAGVVDAKCPRCGEEVW